MHARRRAATKALIALVAAAATPHVWVAAPAVLYLIRFAETEARHHLDRLPAHPHLQEDHHA